MDNIIKIISSKTDEAFDLNLGLNEKNINEIILHSNQDEIIRKNTSDYERFRDLDSFNKRLKETDRIYYTLTDNNSNLTGLFWIGRKSMPNADYISEFDSAKCGITFAIRIYQNYRGKNLAVPFLKSALEAYKNSEEYQSIDEKGIWLAIHKDNLPAYKTYKDCGFVEVGSIDDSNQLIMVLKD